MRHIHQIIKNRRTSIHVFLCISHSYDELFPNCSEFVNNKRFPQSSEFLKVPYNENWHKQRICHLKLFTQIYESCNCSQILELHVNAIIRDYIFYHTTSSQGFCSVQGKQARSLLATAKQEKETVEIKARTNNNFSCLGDKTFLHLLLFDTTIEKKWISHIFKTANFGYKLLA